MSKQANKTVIGAFVVGAVALAVTGVLLFGSGRFFSEMATCVLYFQGSVKGLNVGSPVNFRGVKIGSVTNLTVRFDPQERSFRIPVLIEIDMDRISGVGYKSHLSKVFAAVERKKILQEMVDHGLRAQLQLESLVTGLLGVGLDFYPGTPAKLVDMAPEYPEIPTIPSNIEELERTLDKAISTIEKLPLDTLAKNLVETAQGINQAVNSPQMRGSISSLNETLKDVRTLVQNVDSQIGPLASSIEATVKDVQKMVQNFNGQITPLTSSAAESLNAVRAALEQTQKTLSAVENMTAENSTLRYELADTLEQIADAARSIRVLADYFEQHPEALLRGKGESGGK